MALNDSGFDSDDMTPKRGTSETLSSEESNCGSLAEMPGGYIKQDPKDYDKISLKIKVYDKEYNYETNGKETIPDMMDRMLREIEHGHKPNLGRLLFKTKNDDFYLNLGLPTGALKDDVEYECTFMGRSEQKTTDFVREYNVQEFHKDWKINSFDVKFESHVKVSFMQKFSQVTKVRVNFFPKETLYEALCRDGRFINIKGKSVLRAHDFISVDGNFVLLSVEAINYAGQYLMFKKRRHPNEALPVDVQPLLMPSHLPRKTMPTALKVEPLITQRSPTAESLHSMLQPTATSTPAHNNVRKLQSYEDLTLYLEVDLGLKLKSERSAKKEEQRKKKVKAFFKEHYQNFALNFPYSFRMLDLEHFTKLKLSIGAVVAVNASGVERFQGTCFRIGKKFVLTNYHVIEKVNNFAGGCFKNCFIHFNFKAKKGHSIHFVDVPFWSKELDYAIIELDTLMCDLPASMTDLGYSIAPPHRQLVPGEHLSLVGHPNGMEQMVNISCPIKPPKEIEDHLSLTLHVLEEKEFLFYKETILQACTDQNSVVYDVSNFFWGSSGSPGVLIDEKLLIVLHCGGVLLQWTHVLERGILLSSMLKML